MSLNLNELQQKADRVIHNADEAIRKWVDFLTQNNTVSLQYYDKNGNLQTKTFKSRQQLEDEVVSFINNGRRQMPFVNILKNANMLDIDGDGALDSPLSGYVAGDYSIVSKKVYKSNDSAVPTFIKEGMVAKGILTKDSNGNYIPYCCKVPFNVQQFVIKGTDYNTGHFFFIPYNPVKGIFSSGALVVGSSTGNIRVEGLGELTPNVYYKNVVFRSGESRNHHIDVPWIRVKGQADIWVVGPWVVPGKFSDKVGADIGHPLFTRGNYQIG